MGKRFIVTINSTMVYVVAFLLTTINHEFSHALLGVINGSKPILHHNYVEHMSGVNIGVWG